ncbi:MAG: SPOR domain-containing protein [Calditrichaceae bacterium]|nr:SPOR domain-containing protein [Calditrichaceae bacterium]MBN2707920.1 SPOR domain-containing protein [Calditrichaceae bacterium]RQV92316.1 MAG: SPOR domain-containing protein [Calditrichota bacterium]
MRYFVFFIIVSFFIAGCASSKKSAEPDVSVQPKSSKYDESFDPLTLNDNDVVIQKKESSGASLDEEKTEIEVDEIKKSSVIRELDGYRVQILATKDIESATMVQQTAASQFKTMDHKVYIVFESPQYKVRIGDVVTRNEAEDIRDLAKDYGYKGAFIVRSKVTVKTP